MRLQNIEPDQISGFDVYDHAGDKLGSVDKVWIDDATNELEFIAVKTGMVFGKTHLIPAANANITDRRVTVPFTQDQFKNAPTFPTDRELTPTEENEIYSYYGDERSVQESSTGLAEGGENITTGPMNAPNANSVDTRTTSDRGVVPSDAYSEKREGETGHVHSHRVVDSGHRESPVEFHREHIEVERVDATDAAVPTTGFQEHEIEVPVTREESVTTT